MIAMVLTNSHPPLMYAALLCLHLLHHSGSCVVADGGEVSLGSKTTTSHTSEEGLILRDGGYRAIDIIGYIFQVFVWSLLVYGTFGYRNIRLLLQYIIGTTHSAMVNREFC